MFLCLVTLIQSQGPRTYVSNFMDQDMEIENDTMSRADNRQWKNILDEDFLKQLSDTEGVDRVSPVLAARSLCLGAGFRRHVDAGVLRYVDVCPI